MSAWSPYKDTVISYVAAHPGCCKWDVAKHVTRDRRRCPSKQYYIVNTAIKHGWIGAQWRGRSYRLYVMTPEIEAKIKSRKKLTPEEHADLLGVKP